MLISLLLLSTRIAWSIRLFTSYSPRAARSILNLNQGISASKLHLSSTNSPSTTDETTYLTEKKSVPKDVLITGLNEFQDISVKIISCRELLQENIFRQDMTPVAAKALGEVMTCAVMMGAGLKGETLQVNFVGSKSFNGLKNVLVITNGELQVRGQVGEPKFSHPQPDNALTSELFGDYGEVQVVRNHPSYKAPTNGIVAMRDTKISMNLAMYMAESEQRTAVLLTDVRMDGGVCTSALGLMLERLPGATDENVERSIKNLEAVEKKGLYSYLSGVDEGSDDESRIASFTAGLNHIVDDCLDGMGEGIRWSKEPVFKCTCGVERVWRALQLLDKEVLTTMF